MHHRIPEIMLAVGLSEIDGSLITRKIPVPVPGDGEVLVKVAASPVNPSDLARIKHLPLSERKSFIAGIEGSGIIVGHGKGLLPGLWMGKRVACSAAKSNNGTWAEYMVTSAMACVPLPASISNEQGAMLLVNPMTAIAFLKIARSGNHKAIINTAAGSILGRMVEFLAARYRIPLIQIVRTEKQRELIASKGAEYVLNSSATNFESVLHDLAKKLYATIALDAVGGEMTRRLLLAVPYGSTVVVYGNFSGEQPLVDYRSMVTDNKKVSGFYLVNWLKENGMLNTLKCIMEARSMLKNHITIPVQAKFALDQVQMAVDMYKANMSGGKVLLVP